MYGNDAGTERRALVRGEDPLEIRVGLQHRLDVVGHGEVIAQPHAVEVLRDVADEDVARVGRAAEHLHRHDHRRRRPDAHALPVGQDIELLDPGGVTGLEGRDEAGIELLVPGDLSSAAFFMVAALMLPATPSGVTRNSAVPWVTETPIWGRITRRPSPWSAGSPLVLTV